MGFPRSNWSTLDRTDSPFLLPGSFLPPRRWFGLSRFQCGRLHYCTFSPISVVVLFYPPITIITSVGSVPPHPVLVIRCVSSAVRNYGKSSVIYFCLAFYCVSYTGTAFIMCHPNRNQPHPSPSNSYQCIFHFSTGRPLKQSDVTCLPHPSQVLTCFQRRPCVNHF